MPKTNAERQKEDRKKKKASGLVKKGYWIKLEWHEQIRELIERLRNDKND